MSYGTGTYGGAPYGAETTAGDPNTVLVDSTAVGSSLAVGDYGNQVGTIALTATVADAVEGAMTLKLVSSAVATDLAQAPRTHVAALAEALAIDARLRLVLEAIASDAGTLASTVSGGRVATIALADALVGTSAATNSITAMAVVSDALALTELIRSIADGEASDTAALADTLEGLRTAMETVVVEAVLSEEALGLAVVTVLVPDTAGVGEEASTLSVLQAAIDDELDLTVSLTLDGLPYLGLALNARNRAVTEYSAFDYNSLASYGGKLYGAGEGGLYRLEGSDDDGAAIAAFARTAMQRVAGGKAARVSDAYLGFRANGDLQLKVVVREDDGRRIGYVYDLVRGTTGAAQSGRFKVGRGLKSVYMAFELSNVAGADFAVDVLEVRPLVLDRRI